MQTDPEKIEAIQKMSMPKSVSEVRSFLGTAGWYRRFIKNFSTTTAPLTNLIQKYVKFKVTIEATESFKDLKKALTSAPLLAHPDFKKRYYVQCDASDCGVGAVLFQTDDEKIMKDLLRSFNKKRMRRRKIIVSPRRSVYQHYWQ